MQLHKKFTDHIREARLFSRTDRLLLAVSGGVDSVALCELCHQAGFAFSIAHANFQLRGKESEGDEEFVRQLADKYRVPVHVRLFETERFASEKKISIQVAARELRYSWFDELLHAGHRWLLTAHHADDNTETMLMHFFRGTGISGLRGMLPKTNNIVRPLLPFSRAEIVAFARQNNLAWREDSSNSSDKYSRNYFRNNIIPAIRNIFPQADRNLAENIQRFRDAEELYDQAIAFHKSKLIEIKGNEIHIPVLKLKKISPLRTIMHEILKPYHFSAHQLDDVLSLLDAPHGKFIKSETHRIIKNRNWLIIAENEPQASDLFVIEEGQLSAANGALELQFFENGKAVSKDVHTADIDAREISFPLLIRKWRQGDYFYPLGMAKKKKISRFLIDQKLSPTQKEKVFVVESNKKICWVAGLRIDDRFKVTDNTKKVMRLTFHAQVLK